MHVGSVRLKGIVVGAADLLFNRRFAIKRNRGVEILPEDSQVVESEQVVSMVVSEDRSVDEINPLTDELKA